jgi:pimeloyl-ACP methyl ester carboxylesterase
MVTRGPNKITILARAAPLAALVVAGCQSVPPLPGKSRPAEVGARLDASLAVLASPKSSERERASARASYRTAVSGHLDALLEQAGNPPPALAQASPGAVARPDAFAKISPVTRPRIRAPGLHREGAGLPVVARARRAGPNTPRSGFRVPLTLVALPGQPPTDCCDAALLDPQRAATIGTRHGELPLAMDLEAALDATSATGSRFGAALINLVRPGAFQGDPRIVFLAPFDPEKTPVVMVHGLLSTPRTWVRLGKELMADPDFRDCCQLWFFYYPTGQPVPLSALQLRDALDDAVAVHEPRKPMILLGHSMGGILSRVQVSRITPDQAEGIVRGVSGLSEQNRIRRALVFEPRTDVSRVVFLFTPHRGSRLASSGLGAWGIRLIRLPSTLADEVVAASQYLAGLEPERMPTSIHGLSPDSAFLRVLNATRPVVPTHTILGDRGRGDGWAGSDGVVPYASAHLSVAESELVVPTGHGGMAHADSVAEIKRIIALEVSGQEGISDAGVAAAR